MKPNRLFSMRKVPLYDRRSAALRTVPPPGTLANKPFRGIAITLCHTTYTSYTTYTLTYTT